MKTPSRTYRSSLSTTKNRTPAGSIVPRRTPPSSKSYAREDRRRGGVIEKIKDMTGASAEIRLDKATLTFSVRVGDTVYADKNGDTVRGRGYDLLREQSTIAWTPAIRVQLRFPEAENYNSRVRAERVGGCEVEFRRLWLAVSPGGDGVRMADWDEVDPKAGDNRNAFEYAEHDHSLKPTDLARLPISDKDDHDTVWTLPYDEALYEGLDAVCGTLNRARDRLLAMLDNAEGRATIASAFAAAPLALESGPPQRASVKRPRSRKP